VEHVAHQVLCHIKCCIGWCILVVCDTENCNGL